jgi:hypothetical protein
LRYAAWPVRSRALMKDDPPSGLLWALPCHTSSSLAVTKQSATLANSSEFCSQWKCYWAVLVEVAEMRVLLTPVVADDRDQLLKTGSFCFGYQVLGSKLLNIYLNIMFQNMSNSDFIVTTLKLFQQTVIFLFFFIEAVHIVEQAIKTVLVLLMCRLSCAFVWYFRSHVMKCLEQKSTLYPHS